jgi:hypothetical protein
MSVLKLNLAELLEKYDNNIDSELSGGKGKKRPKKPKRKPKKPKRGESDDSESDESETSYGRGRGRGRGEGRGMRLQEEVEELKDVIAHLEEKILMLENRLDNL